MTRLFLYLLLIISSATNICLGGKKNGNTSNVKHESVWWTINTAGGEHGNDYENDFQDKSDINQDYWDDSYEDSFYDSVPKGCYSDIQGSVAFVIDTTSSMIEALPMIKQMIADLVKNAPKIPTWVLAQFKDPEVKLLKITSDAEELKSGLDSLRFGGGGDLPEQALKGIEVTLDHMPDNGVILVVTDAGSHQHKLEKSIRKKSQEKNVKITFAFSPSCRAHCRRSLPIYKRLSEGRMFNRSDFSSETFYKSVVSTVMHPCPHGTFSPITHTRPKEKKPERCDFGCGCDCGGRCDDGSIVMLCRNPTLNRGFYFDKTFEEYKKGFHKNGEGWFGLEHLHKLTSDTKGSYKLKVTLTSRDWQEYVGYWDWLKVGPGDGYKLTLGSFHWVYSTLGDALSPDPCMGMARAANMKFSAKDKDQDMSTTTHCANENFSPARRAWNGTTENGRWQYVYDSHWRRGGWWHAGRACSEVLPTGPDIFWWWNGAPATAYQPIANTLRWFAKKGRNNPSLWMKMTMVLIPSASPPFEPNPGHNQTMLGMMMPRPCPRRRGWD